MKWLRYLMIILAAIILTTGPVGCAGKSVDGESVYFFYKKPPLTELNFYFKEFSAYSRPYTDDVVKEIEKRTSDRLNVKLNINWISERDFNEEINELLKSGDKIDAYLADFANVLEWDSMFWLEPEYREFPRELTRHSVSLWNIPSK